MTTLPTTPGPTSSTDIDDADTDDALHEDAPDSAVGRLRGLWRWAGENSPWRNRRLLLGVFFPSVASESGLPLFPTRWGQIVFRTVILCLIWAAAIALKVPVVMFYGTRGAGGLSLSVLFTVIEFLSALASVGAIVYWLWGDLRKGGESGRLRDYHLTELPRFEIVLALVSPVALPLLIRHSMGSLCWLVPLPFFSVRSVPIGQYYQSMFHAHWLELALAPFVFFFAYPLFLTPGAHWRSLRPFAISGTLAVLAVFAFLNALSPTYIVSALSGSVGSLAAVGLLALLVVVGRWLLRSGGSLAESSLTLATLWLGWGLWRLLVRSAFATYGWGGENAVAHHLAIGVLAILSGVVVAWTLVGCWRWRLRVGPCLSPAIAALTVTMAGYMGFIFLAINLTTEYRALGAGGGRAFLYLTHLMAMTVTALLFWTAVVAVTRQAARALENAPMGM